MNNSSYHTTKLNLPKHEATLALPRKRVEVVRISMVRESSFLAERVVKTPEDAHQVFLQFFGGESDREQFALLCLDSKNRPNSIHMVSIGTLNASLVHPRECFKAAILSNSASIICAHGHSSGDPTPSPEDIQITQRLVDSGELLGITVLNHLILGSTSSFLSMKEKGLI